MKCKNCGAELNNGKCAYCGSVCYENMYYLPVVNVNEDTFHRVIHDTRPLIVPQEELEIISLSEKEPLYVRGI